MLSKNDFVIENLIGKGIFGKIHQGYNIKTKEKVALKIISIDDLSEKGDYFLKALKIEEDNMKKCECLNTAKFFGHFESGNNHVIVMELCDESLQKYLMKKENGMTAEEIFECFSQLNNALKKMVENKIIHRDIQTVNILLKYINSEKTKFIPKLSDFVLSKKLKEHRTNTQIGSCQIIAPEIILEKIYDSKADLWSLGLMLYYCYFKEYPYEGKTKNDIYKLKVNGIKLKRPKGFFLADLIEKMLVIEPNNRISWEEYFEHPFFKYSSISEFQTGIYNNNYKCFTADYNSNNKNNNIKKVLIKSYKKNFLSDDIYNKEYELFTNENKNNINVLKLINKFEYKDENNETIINFAYNLNDNFNSLFLYSKINDKFEEKDIKIIAKILIDIFLNVNKNNSHIFISLYSFLMTNNKEIKLYDFGLNKYFLSENDKRIYYSPNIQEMLSSIDYSKTLVMNYGMTLLLFLNNNDKNIIIEKNKFVLKTKNNISPNLYSFLNKCLCPNNVNRPNFVNLKSDEFIKDSFDNEIIEEEFFINEKQLDIILDYFLVKYNFFQYYYNENNSSENKFLELDEYLILFVIYEIIILKKILKIENINKLEQNELSILKIIYNNSSIESYNLNSINSIINNMKLIDINLHREKINNFLENIQNIYQNLINKYLEYNNITKKKKYIIDDDNIDENFFKFLIQNFNLTKYLDLIKNKINIIDKKKDNYNKNKNISFIKYIFHFLLLIKQNINEVKSNNFNFNTTKQDYINAFNNIFDKDGEDYIIISTCSNFLRKFVKSTGNMKSNEKKEIKGLIYFYINIRPKLESI